MILDWDKWCPI